VCHSRGTTPSNAVANFDLDEVISNYRNAANIPHNHPVTNLDIWTPAYMAKLNPIQTVSSTSSLLEVCQRLEKGVHRVAVIDHDDVIHRIISQSFVVALLNGLVKEVENAGSLNLRALGMKEKHVYSCVVSAPAITAFEMMNSHKIPAIAITDANNTFVTQLTPQHLHHFLQTRDMSEVHKPLDQFLDIAGLTNATVSEITVTLSTPLLAVFDKFQASKSHRLFVVDDNNKVVGVCSIKDLLSLLLDTN
jgi:CBS-domain-containing membrane protein